MSAPRLGRSTIAVHGLPAPRRENEPVVAPIMQSATFANAVGSEREVLYSRYGNNPNQQSLARKYALLEGAEDAVFRGQRHGRDRAGPSRGAGAGR